MRDALRQFKADVFQALAHPTRVAIVEILCDGEQSAGSLVERLGVEPANASQHLAVLRSRRIVEGRREGNQVIYSLRDPLLMEVLEVMRRYFQAHLTEATAMLQDLHDERPASSPAGSGEESEATVEAAQ
ncbi:MAG: ArsR/SmtB family transcription factor [Armatimonadota bacterium]